VTTARSATDTVPSVPPETGEHLLERGAQTIILGCTELPLAMELYSLKFPTTDPTLELARGAVAFATAQIRVE